MFSRIFASVFYILSLYMLSAAQCKDPIYVSRKGEPAWVRGLKPPDTDVSYFEVVFGQGINYDKAYASAEEKIMRRRSLATGRNVVIHGDSAIKYYDNLEILSKIEEEYIIKCRADEYYIYLLAQIGKRPDVGLPPIPEEFFSKQKKQNENFIEQETKTFLLNHIFGLGSFMQGNRKSGLYILGFEAFGAILVASGFFIVPMPDRNDYDEYGRRFDDYNRTYEDDRSFRVGAKYTLIISGFALLAVAEIINIVTSFNFNLAILPTGNGNEMAYVLMYNRSF